MNLYIRDYSKPSKSEKEAIAKYEEWNDDTKKMFKNTAEDPRHSHPDYGVREFLWHYTSLFPNNHLIFPPSVGVNYKKEAVTFREIIDSASNEHELQRYIKHEI